MSVHLRHLQYDGGITRRKVVAVIQARGKLALAEYLRLSGAVFCGWRGFGDTTVRERGFHGQSLRFGPNRKDGARRLKYLTGGIVCLRDLQVNLIGVH